MDHTKMLEGFTYFNLLFYKNLILTQYYKYITSRAIASLIFYPLIVVKYGILNGELCIKVEFF